MSEDKGPERPDDEPKDLDPAEEAERVRGGAQPRPGLEPHPPAPGGPVPVPYPNT